MKRVFWLFFLMAFLAGACAGQPQTSQRAVTGSAEAVIAQSVAATLEALTSASADTSQPDWGDDAPDEQFSVEVTQPAASTDRSAPSETADVLSGDTLPESHYIWNILGHRQFFPIGCEASAADDWAKYFGVEVNEFAFQVRLPVSDNPDLGFVGDVNGPWGQVPPFAYGVHAMPVAQVLREFYGMDAVGVKGFTTRELKEQIAADKPVITWVVANCTWSEPYTYTDKAGNKVVTAPYEHVVIVTGYDETSFRYMNNGKFYDIPTEYFERTWSVLGNMVVYLDD